MDIRTRAFSPIRFILFSLLPLWSATAIAQEAAPDWQEITTRNEPSERHENGFVQAGDRYYLIGGRGIKPVDVYDPAERSWSEASPTPLEVHHFQAVEHHGLIYVLGALTGGWPHESPTSHIYVYDPLQDMWTVGAEIPAHRRRGAAGAVVHEDKIYLVAGIVNGHTSHWVPWLDEFDPSTNTWQELPDAPHARDHFHAAVLDGKLYAAGGRRSGYSSDTFSSAVRPVDVFDFATGTWSTLSSPAADIPTERAGTAVFTTATSIVVLGGESDAQELAHDEVEALHVATGTWRSLPALATGRHGTQAIQNGRGVFVVAGSARRGGGPEITALESLTIGVPGSQSGEALAAADAAPGEALVRGDVVVKRIEHPEPGVVDVILSNEGGNQAIIITHASAVGAMDVGSPGGFPFVLAPGSEASISARFDPDAPDLSTLLVKTAGRGAPLQIPMKPGQEAEKVERP